MTDNTPPMLAWPASAARASAKWSQPGSNRRPLACHASALPAELWPLGRPSVAASGGGDLDRGDVAPELFQPVERPRLRGEDVQDDVEEVGDDPGRLALAVHRLRQGSLLVLQPDVHLVPDRLRLPRVLPGADDEVVGVGA